MDYDNIIITTQSSIDTTSTELDILKEQITNLQSNVEALESQVTQQETEINNLKSRQTENEQRIQDLTLKVELLEYNIYTKSELDNKLTAIDNMISQLAVRIKKVESQIVEILKKLKVLAEVMVR